MSAVANNAPAITPNSLYPQIPSYLSNIIHKKVHNIALGCVASLVHWFLTTFSCLYPSYSRLYQLRLADAARHTVTRYVIIPRSEQIAILNYYMQKTAEDPRNQEWTRLVNLQRIAVESNR